MDKKIKAPQEGFSREDVIAVLENIRARTYLYERCFPYMSREYCEQLAEIEGRAIDEAIIMLRNPEKPPRAADADNLSSTST